MRDDRAARGARPWGDQRWRRLLTAAATLAVATALAVAAPPAPASGASISGGSPTAGAASRGNPFAGRGMWIWYVSASSGGSIDSIVSTARAYGITTVMIKAGDGSTEWSQFNNELVYELHRAGLKVCAWQYVYGQHPISEAYVGAHAVHQGADCLLIDAESEYETVPHNYVQAQTYIKWLRGLIGYRYPVGLAGFPYVDFHPGFPYSVFMGPGGAQFNVPQMYWKDIQTTVDAVYAHTFEYNELYRRPIAPIGQVYANPHPWQIFRFRQISRLYDAVGISWWDWQEASRSGWISLSRPAGSLSGAAVQPVTPTLGNGAIGDLVVWAQERLVSAGFSIPIDGGFGKRTQKAVQIFQRDHNLQVDGVIGPATWQALLKFRIARVHWTDSGPAILASAATAADHKVLTLPEPKNHDLPAKANEIPPSIGKGMPPGVAAKP